MVVCKYFMEGYCKYGLRCKFDHVNSYGGYDSTRSSDFSSSERTSGTSILRSSNTSFGGQEVGHGFIQSPQQQNYPQKVSPGLKCNVQEIMHIVSKDISQLEKSNQWHLSSYSPLKDLPNIPGLEDYSPEELRWEFYKALQNGSLPLWQAIVQQLYANVAKVNNELKRKESGYAIIDRWLRDAEENCRQTNLASSFSNVTSPDLPNATQLYTPTDTHTAGNSCFSFTLSTQQPMNIQTYPVSDSVFASNQASVFPASNQNLQSFSSATHQHTVDNQAYSTVEELVEGELEAFKAGTFSFGTIPKKPPPKVFCNL